MADIPAVCVPELLTRHAVSGVERPVDVRQVVAVLLASDLADRHFWQERGWASGFREYARGGEEAEWTFEIDAGPILDGFGTSANAFAVAAARRNGRFDHAYTLSTQLVATAWPLPDGTLLLPRGASHAADAPYLGEAAIAYFLTVPPAEGVEIVEGGEITALVALPLAVYFGISGLVFAWVFRAVRRHLRSRSEERSAAPGLQLGIAGACTLGAAMLFLQGSPLFAVVLALVGQIALFRRAGVPVVDTEASRPVRDSSSPPVDVG